MTQPHRRYTLDEYFTFEEASATKHEYRDGEIVAMSGASLPHNAIAVNVVVALQTALRGTGCRAFGSDLRIATPGRLYTYPDVSVVCGPPVLVPDRPDTVTNPMLLVEVLSDATRTYDRGPKLTAYQEIPTLREVLLIEQGQVGVVRWQRVASPAWTSDDHPSIDDTIALASVAVRLRLSEVYREAW